MMSPESRAPTHTKHARRRWKPVACSRPRAAAWKDGRVLVLSELATMDAPDSSGDALPTWLVSVSEQGLTYASDAAVKRVRQDFGMRDAEEDNHESGRVRKLFLVVDPKRRVECECKEDETTIVRGDGYRYTQPRLEGSPRR